MKIKNPQQLPDGWSVETIEDVAEVNPRLNKADIPDNLPVSFVPMSAVGAGDGAIDINQERLFSEVKKGFTPFQEGDVLFAKITPCMENGKMAAVPKVKNGYGFGSTEFHVLRPKESMDARYLYYYISNKSFRNEAAGHMAGAVGQKRVPTAYLKECKIPVAPLDQQKRIVAEIEKQFSHLDEAVANLKRVKANLKRYKATVLKAAIEGKLTEQWRKEYPDVEPASKLLERIVSERGEYGGKERYSEAKKSDVTNFPKLPEGWTWARLETISDAIGGYAFKSKKFVPTGFQILKMANIRMGRIDLAQSPSFIEDVAPEVVTKYSLLDGDIVVTLTGTRKKRDYGYVALVRSPKNLLLNQRIARLRPVKGVHPEFLQIALQSKDYRNRFFAYETGNVGQGNVGMSAVTREPVALPPTLEQHQIVNEVGWRLSIAEEIETEVINNLQRAEKLRFSVLASAFRGRLMEA